jgi:hypothetical protein
MTSASAAVLAAKMAVSTVDLPSAWLDGMNLKRPPPITAGGLAGNPKAIRRGGDARHPLRYSYRQGIILVRGRFANGLDQDRERSMIQ